LKLLANKVPTKIRIDFKKEKPTKEEISKLKALILCGLLKK
jgi:hypothetical protein